MAQPRSQGLGSSSPHLVLQWAGSRETLHWQRASLWLGLKNKEVFSSSLKQSVLNQSERKYGESKKSSNLR